MRSIIFLCFLALAGCGPKPYVSTVIPVGSSKAFTCEQYILIYNRYKTGSQSALCRYDFQNNYSYFSEFKTEIITNDNFTFYVFEDVNSRMYCTFLGCSLGDGKLKLITRDKSEAIAATNPRTWAEYQEQEKIRIAEEQRIAKIKAIKDAELAKIRAKEEESRLLVEKKKCGSDKNLDGSWKFNSNKSIMEYTFKSKSDKPILITAIGLTKGDEKIIFEEKKERTIGPYEVGSVIANTGNINTDLAKYGFFRCEWTTKNNTSSNTRPNIKSDSPSGAKNILEKILK